METTHSATITERLAAIEEELEQLPKGTGQPEHIAVWERLLTEKYDLQEALGLQHAAR